MLKFKGFTLVELMIVVAIIAILASIAYPAYQDQVQKARRADGTSTLLDIASKLERYHSEFGSYTANLGTGNAGLGFDAAANTNTTSSSEGYYQISIVLPAGNQTFTLTADAAGSIQVGDTKCGNFTLTHTGVPGISGTATVDDCW